MKGYNRMLGLWAGLTGRPWARRLNNLLFNLAVRGLGVGNMGHLSGEEAWLRRLSKDARLQASGVVLVDIGANEGSYSAALRRLFPRARIIAFEPHPATVGRLRARLGQTVEIHALAVGAQPGRSPLWDYAREGGSSHASLVPGVIERIHGAPAAAVEVTVTSLDSFFHNEQLGRIDLLKIDVEGSEIECLRGAQGLIGAGRIDRVQFEFNTMHLASRVFFRDFMECLPGFSFFRLLPYGWVEIDRNDPLRQHLYDIQNIVALSPRIAAAGSAAI